MAEEQETTTQDNPVVEETLLGSGESDNPADWRSSLSEELKNDPTIQNINDIEAAAKTLVHQQKRMGGLVPIPKTDEEKAELYGKLGRPETAEKYEIDVPDTHQQFFSEENVKQFRAMAHNIGLNNDQVKALIDYQVGAINSDIERGQYNISRSRDETEESLRKEWGFDYDKQIKAAHRALDVYGDDELRGLMDTEAGNHPAVIRLFARLGEDVTEDMAKNTQNNTLATSVLDAKDEISKVFADKDHAYHKADHPEHREAVNRMQQLHEKVYGA